MKLSVKEKASYGVGAVGKDMVYALVAGYLMYYYKTILGMSGTFVGIVFMIARIFDAVNDPFMGILVDKANLKHGKFKPWLLMGTIVNGIILVLMFSLPTTMHGNVLKSIAAIVYILWGMTYTVMDIPYWSMIPAITEPGKDRENLSVIARSCASLGYAIPTAITITVVPILGELLNKIDEKVAFINLSVIWGDNVERAGFCLLALLVAIFFITAISITVCNVKERRYEKKESVSIGSMLSALIHNDQAIVVVVAIVVFNASLYLTQQLAIYFFKYDIGNGNLYGVFATFGGAAQVLAMLSLPFFRKFMGCKKLLVTAICTAIAGYCGMFALGTFGITNTILLCACAIIIFFGFGLATVLTTIFLADTVDYGEWKSNQRNESAIFSLQTFVVKLASAFSVFIAGVGLDVIKLNESLPAQTAETLLGLRVIMLVVPIAGLIFSIIFFIAKYKLTEEKIGEIIKELEERRETSDNPAE